MTNQTEYNYLIKIIIIGDSGVGKSSIIQSFTEPDKSLLNRYIATIGIDFRVKQVIIGNKTIRLQIWDTAGQERFKTITQSYYRGAHAVIVVFDHTSKESFYNIERWIENYKRLSTGDIDVPMIIMGNKIELVENELITMEMINRIAEKYKIKYYPVSAITGKNIDSAFIELATETVKKGNFVDNAKNTIIVSSDNKNETQKCCQ